MPHGVLAPEALARRKLNRVKLSLCAERVHHAVGDHGHRARSLVESEIVTVRGRITVLPLSRARTRIERLDDLATRHAMKENHAALRHDRSADPRAGAGPHAPHAPPRAQTCFAVCGFVAGSESDCSMPCTLMTILGRLIFW